MIRHAPSIGIGIGLSLRSTAFGSAPAFSAEAANYFSRLDAAGDTTYVDYKQPLANYIDSLVSLGGAYWDDMKSSTSFVGVGIQGITVPLRSGMTVPTQNNFVDADLNQLTGLKSDASTKYINTNWDHGTSSQDDFSVSVYPTTTTTTGYLFGAGRSGISGISNMSAAANCRNHAIAQKSGYSNSLAGNISGSSRSSSTGFNVRSAGTDFAATVTSEAPLSRNLFVFSRTLDGSDTAETLTDARLATYHAGPALNLATLEGLQATLLSEIATARLILDVYPNAAAAYSLRALSSSFASNAVVRVRRDSDNAELDFTATEVSDGTLLTWVGTGGTDNGFVETWYDQSGNGNDASQLTAASQPKIVDAGTLVTTNGNPTVDFYDNCFLDTDAFLDGSAHSSFAATNNQETTSTRKLFYTKAEFPNKGFTWNYRGDQSVGQYDLVSYNGIVNSLTFSNSTSPLHYVSSLLINSTKEVFINGNSVATSSDSFVADDGTLSIGSLSFGNGFDIQEIIIYGSDQSAKRPAIEANIINHYDI